MFGELVVLAITYMVLHYLTGVILRAKRAPLPLPPGPRGYPVVGALPLLGRAPHRALAALARLHGPIMHLTLGRQGLVVASTPESARLLLKDHGGSFLDRPVDDAAPMVLAYGAQDIVFAPYGPKWRRLRRECSAGLLGSKALDDWADTRHEEVGRMVRAMSRRGEALEVPEFLFGAMANMIGQAVVGRRVLDEDDGEATRSSGVGGGADDHGRAGEHWRLCAGSGVDGPAGARPEDAAADDKAGQGLEPVAGRSRGGHG
ncbi:hypothetical protein ZWY2020_042129 [Hordeum vulgare]|nr:hypothetical protein ZWY2020_042129 [Hordeum vulgare]